MREVLLIRQDIKQEKQRWEHEISEFRKEFVRMAAYKE
jgi:hypothetical protein